MQLGISGTCWFGAILLACASAATIPSVINETKATEIPRQGLVIDVPLNETEATGTPVIDVPLNETEPKGTPRQGLAIDVPLNETEPTGTPREELAIDPPLNETEPTARPRRELSLETPLPQIPVIPKKGVARMHAGPYGYTKEKAKGGMKFRFNPDSPDELVPDTNAGAYGYTQEKSKGGMKFRFNPDNPDEVVPDSGPYGYTQDTAKGGMKFRFNPDNPNEMIPEPGNGGDMSHGESGEGSLPQSERILSQHNVAVIRWTQASMPIATAKKYNTVGAVIATNAIVSSPSGRVPVSKQETSNWNVESLRFPLTKKSIKGKDLVVVYHPDFSMNPDGPSRLALIMLTPGVERATELMMPIKMVASPFITTDSQIRHDSFALANCVMVVNEPRTHNVVSIGMTATMCRYNKNAKKAFTDKICAYMQMRTDSPNVKFLSLEYKGDLGSPLICGNVLVGVYAGVQNTRGTFQKEAGGDVERSAHLGKKLLDFDEMFTFTVPGAIRNYEFLSGFINEDTKEMRWDNKINLKETNECKRSDDGEPDENVGMGVGHHFEAGISHESEPMDDGDTGMALIRSENTDSDSEAGPTDE